MKSYLKAGVLALCIAAIGIAFASRDGSGTYTLPAGNPVSTGTTISSTWANTTLADIATALTNSIAKDGQTVATANLPMGGFKHTNVATATARNHYAAASQVQDGSMQVLGSVAGTNTITGNLNPAITAYAAPLTITLYPANNNTGATTLAVNGLTALDVQKADGDALISGDLVAGIPAVLVLDTGADDWILLNPQATYAQLSQANTFTAQQIFNTAGSIRIGGTSDTATTNISYVSFRNLSGTEIGWVGESGSGSSDLTLTNNQSGANVNIVTTGGGAVQMNGLAIPKTARMRNTNSGAGCTVASDVGITSCSRSSAGRYTVNYTAAGFSAVPVFSVVGGGNSAALCVTNNETSTSADLTCNNVSGTGTDGQFSFIAMGQ